nr:unnamed protein product [Naegleria fowleri]
MSTPRGDSSKNPKTIYDDDDDNDYDDKYKKFTDPKEAAKHTFQNVDRILGSTGSTSLSRRETSVRNSLQQQSQHYGTLQISGEVDDIHPIQNFTKVGGDNQEIKKNNMQKKVITSGWGYVKDFFYSLMFSLIYVTSDTKKRCTSFLVGLITIAIVVFVVSILYNSILKANLIFLKLSEDNVGDADIMFTPKFTNSTTIPFINHTEVVRKLNNNPFIVGTSPRWILYANLQNRDHPEKNLSGILLIIDTEREEKLGIGRIWPYRPLGEGEMHVRDSILRAIDIVPDRGKRVNMVVDFASLASAFSGSDESISQGVTPDQKTINQTELLRTLFEASGFNFSQIITVNITQVANQLGIQIPPPLKPFINAFGIITITGEQAFQAIATTLGGGNFSDLNLKVEGEYTVVSSITSNFAKYPGALGNIMMIDSSYVGKVIGQSLFRSPAIQLLLELAGETQRVKNFFNTFPIDQYALTAVGRFKDRFPAYLKSDNERTDQMIQITNGMVDSLGVSYPVAYTLPLLSALSATKFISLFIDQIFIGVVVMLAILGVVLIFALLLSNVEEKTYEYGMLRALGLRQYSLIQVILAQSMYFAIPAIIIAMILAFLVNILVEYILQVVISTPSLNLLFFWGAVVVPIALGLGIPIVANIIPIRHAMSRTLRDSLDIAHQTFNETTVKMIKLEELGLEPWQTGVAIMLVVIGFVVYYMIPYSFIFTDLPLFFFILNAILLGMLLGLCVIAVVIQPFFERLVLNIILCGHERRLKTLISKNLAGHRKRSRKTFLMFTLSVAFIIFAGVVFSLQSANIRANVESFLGADVVVLSTTSYYSLPKDKLDAVIALQNQNQTDGPPIVGYAYQSATLNSYQYMNDVRFSSLAYYPSRKVAVSAIDSNFLSVVKNQYFLYTYVDKNFDYNMTNGKPDVFQSLYTNAGQALVDGEKVGFAPSRIFSGVKLSLPSNASLSFDPTSQYRQYLDIIASEAMRPSVGIGIKTPVDLRFFTRNKKTSATSQVDYIGKTRCLAYKIPGFFMSSYELTASGSPVLVTMDSYKKVAAKAAQSVGSTFDGVINYSKLFVKLKDDISTTKLQDTVNALQASVNSDFTNIQNVRDLVGSTGTATLVLMAFFNIVAAIAIILCFFMLAVSFTANVKDNSWEFGVLRSIGLSVNALIRAYIYEALCLVVSAFLSGTVIGCVIALTLTAQFNLFLEMPFQFDFPYYLFISMLVMALLCAIFGSYIPARNLRKKEIALVLRGVD